MQHRDHAMPSSRDRRKKEPHRFENEVSNADRIIQT